MAINWVNDLGAPLAVTAVDLTVETVAPQRSDIAAYIICGASWLATAMKWTKSDFVKNVAIASTPRVARGIYDRVRGVSSSPARSLAMRKVSRWPAPLVEQPFGGARLI